MTLGRKSWLNVVVECYVLQGHSDYARMLLKLELKLFVKGGREPEDLCSSTDTFNG